ncbi:MAG TPA: FHA domain-containing protein [Blastocatellia bacterium]|nr:FHA domain-containing protein [Blastocatellia bacterium]
MGEEQAIHISREDLSRPEVDKVIAHQKALLRQSRPEQEAVISPARRLLLSSMFYIPVAGFLGGLVAWLILEPSFDDRQISLVNYLFFPLTGTLIVLFLFLMDGLASRRVRGNIERWASNIGLTIIFSVLAFIPIGLILIGGVQLFVKDSVRPEQLADLSKWPPSAFVGIVVTRSLAWAVMGTAIGLGMNTVRSTRKQLLSSVLGGVVGGAMGGLFFDPIDRFIQQGGMTGALSRAVGLCAVGLCVGLFVALGEQLGREAWVRVKTGPLAGKSFVLYRSSTVIGSSPQADIYLFKDAEIGPEHAAIHRVGSSYEIEDFGTSYGSLVNQFKVRKQRLVSGDQIIIGATVLEFEERARRDAPKELAIKEA